MWGVRSSVNEFWEDIISPQYLGETKLYTTALNILGNTTIILFKNYIKYMRTIEQRWEEKLLVNIEEDMNQ